MRISRGAAVWVLALAAVIAGVVAPRVGARADAANAECTNNDDITIVVDFQELGGGVNVRCAPQPVDSGHAAFVQANIAFDDYRGFVCRIAGKPSGDVCTRYPPASAYWVYWLAARGGSWCPSNNGFNARTPPPGTVDGWSFAKDRRGSQLPPPRYPVPPPIPGTTPHPLNPDDCDATTTRSTSTTAAPSPAPGGGGSAPSPSPPSSRTPTSRRGAPPSTTTVVGGPAATSTSILDRSVDTSIDTTSTSKVPFGNVDLTVRNADKGSPLGFLAGLGAIGVVGVTGFAIRRRRPT